MAVYTHLGAEDIAALLEHYPVGTLASAKGIAEGVSNSNWLIETRRDDGGPTRFILTMYEYRIDIDELPYFLGLLDHLAMHDCPVPRTIHDKHGNLSRRIATPRGEKAVALIEFLPGVSLDHPEAGHARTIGAALARMHAAGSDYPGHRANGMGRAEWVRLAEACTRDGLASIDPRLPAIVESALGRLQADWPTTLPQSVIHADLFPDNVLMLGDRLTGLIDFYFACNDAMAYDLAVTHAAWCFTADGAAFLPEISRQLLVGYTSERALTGMEQASFGLLAQGAALRFTLSRAWDWLNTPADALVTRKDPMAFARRLEFYARADNELNPLV